MIPILIADNYPLSNHAIKMHQIIILNTLPRFISYVYQKVHIEKTNRVN